MSCMIEYDSGDCDGRLISDERVGGIEHCVECGAETVSVMLHLKEVFEFDGETETTHTCPCCEEIRKTYYCFPLIGGVLNGFEEEFNNQISIEDSDLFIDGIAAKISQLTNTEARAYMCDLVDTLIEQLQEHLEVEHE